MKVARVFFFDAAHHLPEYKGKCEQLHGHTYRLEVVIEGKQKKDGMVMDFNELKKIVAACVLDRLDHADLNKMFDNPTAENIAAWIFSELEKKLPLYSVKVWEGDGKWVEVGK